MDESRLLAISMKIQNSVTTIIESCKEKNIPLPTFDVKGSTGVPESLSIAKNEILDATLELHDLLLDPLDHIFIQGHANSLAILQAVTRFGIATNVPVNEQVSFGTLSKRTGLPEPTLKRIIRYAMAIRFFEEPGKGMVAHTNLSKMLLDPNIDQWMTVASEEMWPASTKVVEAISKWPEAQEPNETGFALANNSKTLYDIFSTDPVRAAPFAAGMKAFSTSPNFNAMHLINLYDWNALGDAKLVDIGGNRGHIAVFLATEFPKLEIIVQDIESVIQGAETEIPPELEGRVKFMAQDIFTKQSVYGADVYFLRLVFHNWSDKYCIRILRNLVPVLKRGAKILIQDICLPQPGKMAFWKERLLRSMDLNMLGGFNGKERDSEDWQELFEKAGEHFEFKGISEAEGSVLSLIEAHWMA